MKIAFLIWDYSPSRGGQERYLSRLVGATLARGHEVHVFATRCEQGAERGIRFHRIAVPAAGPFLRTVSFLARGRRMLSAERYDIVSGLARFFPLDVYRMGSGLHRVWMAKKSDRFLARMASYTRPFNWLALWLEHRIFDPSRCRHIIANSSLCRAQLLDLYRYPGDRVSVIYNGVDHTYFHPGLRDAHRGRVREELGLPPDIPVALFASNNLRRKGLDVLIRAIALLRETPVALLVVGRGKIAAHLSLARRLGVEDRVRFLGLVRDMRPVYGASDLLVLPTRYDPFANVCLEAMACGLPVVTTRDNGASEIVTEGDSGFIVADPGDEASLAKAIVPLLDPSARPGMSAAARRDSLPYTIGKNADETLAVYQQLCEERRAHHTFARGPWAMPVGKWQSWLIPLSGTPLKEKDYCAEKGTTHSVRGGSIPDRDGILHVEEQFLPMLAAIGLDSFRAFMNFTGGELLRDKGVRHILRVRLPGPPPAVFYLKRHLRGSLKDTLNDLLRGRRPASAAAREWNAIAALRAAGIRTMPAAAYGEAARFPSLRPSFILTAAAEGTRLEDHCRVLRGKFREKRCIIAALADCVRRMHLAGLNHRDLYLCHLFCASPGGGAGRLTLIDLQRVQRNARDANRWVVKDLAALNYSSPAPAVSRADRIRFLRRYLGARTLDRRAKALCRRVARKTGRIRRHDEKLRLRRAAVTGTPQ